MDRFQISLGRNENKIYAKKQFSENELKLKKSSTEWTLDEIINTYKEDNEHSWVIQLANIASIVPVTNAWPERGGSAIKITKSRSRLMKNDLNAFMQISINGPPLHSKEESALISRVSEQYALARHIKAPKLFPETINATSTSTEVIVDVDLSYKNCSPSEKEQFLNSELSMMIAVLMGQAVTTKIIFDYLIYPDHE